MKCLDSGDRPSLSLLGQCLPIHYCLRWHHLQLYSGSRPLIASEVTRSVPGRSGLVRLHYDTPSRWLCPVCIAPTVPFNAATLVPNTCAFCHPTVGVTPPVLSATRLRYCWRHPPPPMAGLGGGWFYLALPTRPLAPGPVSDSADGHSSDAPRARQRS